MKYEVKVHIYDFSNGWAKTLSPWLLWKDIGGIWHTGIEVYGYEYFFGGGIQKDTHKEVASYLCDPVETKVIGYTEIDEELFFDYLTTLRSKYTYDKYNLFTQNCNHFSNDICYFLTGRNIPKYVLDLPKECENTYVGATFKFILRQLEKIGKKYDAMDLYN